MTRKSNLANAIKVRKPHDKILFLPKTWGVGGSKALGSFRTLDILGPWSPCLSTELNIELSARGLDGPVILHSMEWVVCLGILFCWAVVEFFKLFLQAMLYV